MLETIKEEWLKAQTEAREASLWHQKLADGTLGAAHYKGYLLESFHHAGKNPQIQAFATMFLQDNPREIIDLFYRHARSEIGHDLLAMNDLKALGEEPEEVQFIAPAPSTQALIAYPLYVIQFLHPLGYLGYLFHLEFTPTQQGPEIIEKLQELGVPAEATTFLQEHAEIDAGHNKMMARYVEELVQDDAELHWVCHCARTTCALHNRMIDEAIMRGERLFG